MFMTWMTLGKLVGFSGAVLGVQLPETTLVYLLVPHGIFVEAQVA